jgi:glycosyltransferase involved in cell wall biosynthesis
MKVSIIIPIYNVEQYLRQCLDSAINQTYKNLEIICVDDCGSDNSVEIAQEYAQIKIIKHAKNRGLSAARNTGFAAATGEYIYFLDSDDWIDLDYIEKMVEALEKNHVDAVFNKNILKVFENETKPLVDGEFLKAPDGFYHFSKCAYTAWSWLCKKSFLDKFEMLFPEGLLYEDIFFLYSVIRNLGKQCAFKGPAYYYRQRTDSIMGDEMTRTYYSFDMIEIAKLIYQNYKNNSLTNEYNLPFTHLKWQLERHAQKQVFLEKVVEFFNEIDMNPNLYHEDDCAFYDMIMNVQTAREYLAKSTAYKIKKFKLRQNVLMR